MTVGKRKDKRKKATDKSVTEIVSLIKDNPDFLKGGRFDSVFKKKNQRTLVVDSIRQFAKTKQCVCNRPQRNTRYATHIEGPLARFMVRPEYRVCLLT